MWVSDCFKGGEVGLGCGTGCCVHRIWSKLASAVACSVGVVVDDVDGVAKDVGSRMLEK